MDEPMIPRSLTGELTQLLREYPVITLVGPRQAGKTTLARTLQGYDYCNLELPENRELALSDPKTFLSRFPDKVILDEIQRVPELLSYIQVMVDEDRRLGRFILTGSNQLALQQSITQSLAGRTAILNLLPFSIAELSAAELKFERFEDYAFQGFLPRVYDLEQRPRQAYSNYYQTYVERDVKLLVNLKDASLFEKFMKLLAGRVGQLMDYTSLANDVGVDAKTIRHWLSILESSFIVYRLPPYFENFGKRVIKSPKYYFLETGLLVYLLDINHADQISRDPLLGAIFENLVVVEFLKARYNKGEAANLYFYRDSNNNEVDLLASEGAGLIAVEIKSGSTYRESLLGSIKKLEKLTTRIKSSYLVYTGATLPISDGRKALRFDQIASIFPA